MVRTSKCPGCKVPRADHDFGPPGKRCQGPLVTVESEDEPEAVSALPAGAEGALATLIDSVKSLLAEVKSIREETKELREVVIPPHCTVAAAADTGSVPVAAVASPPVPTHVTLPELRAMTDLASSVDRRVAQLGLASSSDSSESAGDSATKTSRAKVSKSCPRGGKLKSGKDTKPTSAVRFPQFWPQFSLCDSLSARGIMRNCQWRSLSRDTCRFCSQGRSAHLSGANDRNIWFPLCISHSNLNGRPCLAFTGRFSWRSSVAS